MSIDQRLDRIERQLAEISIMLGHLMRAERLDLLLEKIILDNLAELTAVAEKTEGTMDSAIVVIRGIAARIAAAGVDKVKLKALVDALDARANALAFAIDADATGAPPVVPPGTPT